MCSPSSFFYVQSPNFLQIRPADFPTEREHKVFVGMLHKGYSETDLERMFGVYGELKEVRSRFTRA
jgi:hypothetical protein